MVAVTGGVASGKSAVTSLFEEVGIAVADADLIARSVVSIGQPGLIEIVEHFGTELLNRDGSLNRAEMRRLIFENQNARKALEAITHPRIRLELRRQCRSATTPYAIAAIPLLAETTASEYYSWIQRILVVDAPVSSQRTRLILRDGVDLELAERMIGSQADRHRRLSLATDVLINDRTIESLRSSIIRLDLIFRRMTEPFIQTQAKPS